MLHRISLIITVFALGVQLVTPTRVLASTGTFGGQIVWLINGGFTIASGQHCGYLPIRVSGSTVITFNGLTIRPGVQAQVTGVGGCSGINASTVVLSSGVPKHVLTGDYLGAPYGSTAYSWRTYASWLSWAEPEWQNASAIAATGIKTLLYTNPNRQEPGDNMYTTDETTFAHTCTGSRISNIGNSRMNLMDPHSLDLGALWKSVTITTMSKGHFDAVFEDDANDLYGVNAMPCGYLSSNWLTATNSQNLSLGRPILYNGLSILSPGYGVSNTIGLNASSIGGMMEGCYAQPGLQTKPIGAVWQTIENTEILMAQQSKLFVCYANDTNLASASLDVRAYVYASFLLSYDLNTSLLWEYFKSPSGFHVQPESMLVPTGPITPPPSNIAALRLPSGLFAREYSACYVAGAAVGPCAAVVNSDYAAFHAFPYSKYHHTLVLSGGGILDGGTVSVTGAAPAALVAPQTGEIAFQ